MPIPFLFVHGVNTVNIGRIEGAIPSVAHSDKVRLAAATHITNTRTPLPPKLNNTTGTKTTR